MNPNVSYDSDFEPGRKMISNLKALMTAIDGDPDSVNGTSPLADAVRATSAAPNGPTKHLALLILGQMQVQMAALTALVNGGRVSVGIDITPTAR